jgi:hypothetical protein
MAISELIRIRPGAPPCRGLDDSTKTTSCASAGAHPTALLSQRGGGVRTPNVDEKRP